MAYNLIPSLVMKATIRLMNVSNLLNYFACSLLLFFLYLAGVVLICRQSLETPFGLLWILSIS